MEPATRPPKPEATASFSSSGVKDFEEVFGVDGIEGIEGIDGILNCGCCCFDGGGGGTETFGLSASIVSSEGVVSTEGVVSSEGDESVISGGGGGIGVSFSSPSLF
jgi:hypothetical protein